MKKVLSIAVAALVLSVGGAFAEPPVTAVAGDYPGVDNPGLEQLTDADMVGVNGEGWRSGACTLVVKGGGYLLFAAATLAGDPIGQGIGLGLVGAAPAICA